jgi:hydrogenase maturation protein HypF
VLASDMQIERLRLCLRGLAGSGDLGERVAQLATELRLTGFAQPQDDTVVVEVQGAADSVAAFRARALAGLDAALESAESLQPATEFGFHLRDAAPLAAPQPVPPDSAVCVECLAELFEPGGTRYRYPFISCVQCGPRDSILRQPPYVRAHTSMAAFTQCPACLHEYHDAENRRYRDEANACPQCGPHLWLAHADGWRVNSDDPARDAAQALARGDIVAIKGQGGFHLLADARNARAVERLRMRKQREEQPLALMVLNAASAQPLAVLDPAAEAALESPARPIVLLPKRADANATVAAVAQRSGDLGLMLPSTPVHYLLFHEAAQRPSATAWLTQAHPLTLVVTSANPRGEPLARDNREALERLRGIADIFLLHDRDVVVRSEDSVLKPMHDVSVHRSGSAPALRLLRRGRGYVPRPIQLAAAGPPLLAFGGGSHNAVAVTCDDRAFVASYLGVRDGGATRVALKEAIEHLLALTGVAPQTVVHDLAPDSLSAQAAREFAAERGLPAVAVQHHHALAAAVMAERRIDGPALALALDGGGRGGDGRIWGGELLRLDGGECQRLGHLRELALPGGDRAVQEPWRVAASALHALGRGGEIAARFPQQRAAVTLASMLDRSAQSPLGSASLSSAPLSSAMERWFDAAAALLGICESKTFDGQAAMQLEARVARGATALPAGGIDASGPVLDLLPLLAALTREKDAARGAARFHAGVISALDAWVGVHARRHQLSRVVLAGGSFANAVLARGLRARLSTRGLEVLEPEQLPANDGALALGQALVAHRQAAT